MIYRDQNNKPQIPMPQFDWIPDELKAIPQWVLWTYDWIDGQWTKPPYQPSGEYASHSNPDTWNSFSVIETAWYQLNAIEKNSVGVGFVLTKEVGIIGIDLDNCVDVSKGNPDDFELKKSLWRIICSGDDLPDNLVFSPFALDVISRLGDVYIEFSPSRTGLHILVRGQIPQSIKYSKKGIEIYDSLRYFTITGDVWNAGEIREQQESLDKIYRELIQEREKEKGVDGLIENLNEEIANRDVRRSDLYQLQGAVEGVLPHDGMTIAERFRIAFQSQNGLKIQKLFNGDCSAYPDDSEDKVDRSAADFALCRYLAFYSDGSKSILSEMMEQSALIRPKWARSVNSSGQSYLDHLIEKVLSTETNFYTAPSVISPKVDAPLESTRKSRYMTCELLERAIEYRQRTDIRGMECVWGNLNKIYRPRAPMLNIWTGEPGAGKSTFILAYLYHFAMQHRMRTGLCSFELEPPERVLLELCSIHLQANVFDRSVDNDQIREAERELKNLFTVIDLDWHQRNTEGLFEEVDREIAERGLGRLYTDPFTEFQPPDRLMGKYTDFASTQLSLYKECLKRRALIGDLVCHPTKNFNRSEGVKLWNINGSGDFERKADFGLVVSRVNNITVVHIQKRRDRLTGCEDAKAAFELDPDAYYFRETAVPITLGKKEEGGTPF